MTAWTAGVRPILRRHGALVVLSGLVVAVGIAAYVDRGSVTTNEARGRAKNLCPFFRRDEVTEIRLRRDGRSARVFHGELTDAGQRPWQIEIDGVREPAEESAVDQLLGSLRDGVVVRRIASLAASDRKELGLDAPRGEITVQMGAREVHLAFGSGKAAPDGSRYIEVDGHEAAVVTPQLDAALEVSPDALRRKALVTWEAGDLDALSMDGAGGPRHLVRATWHAPRGASFRFDGSTAEGRVRASSAALDNVWEALAHLKADAFLSAPDAEAASKPTVDLMLSPHGGPAVRFRLGGVCPEHPDDVVAVRSQEGARSFATCVPHGALDALSMPASELADVRAIGARADEVHEMTLHEGALTVDLARTGAQWHERTPVDRPVDAEVGRSFVERLAGVQGVLVAGTTDPKALGLDPPRATVRVVSAVGDGTEDRIEQVDVGSAVGSVVHVRRVEDGAVLAVPADAATVLFPDELALRARKVLDLSSSDFRSLRVTSALGTQRLTRNDGGQWVFVEPAGVGPDAGLVAELLDAVGHLASDRWVGAARPEQGLDHPRVSIVAEVGADKTAHTIEIALGAPVGAGASFARLAGDAAVFVAPHALESAATRWLVDRTALLVDVDRLTRATLTVGDRHLVLEPSGGGLRIAGAATDAASTERAKKVRDALRDLLADATVTIGPPLAAQGLEKPTLLIAVEQGKSRFELRFGARDTFGNVPVYFARREGMPATFVVAEARLRPLLDAVR